MNHVLGYPGVYWSARIFVMLVMAITAWIVLLMLARFFRPKHILAMIRADPPKVEELGAEFRGFKAMIRFNAQAAALNVLESRMADVESAVGRLWSITEEHSRALAELSPENGGGGR
ncbi:MAG TPA: hypothetical protein VFJ16_23395 [Longimicrobium sp.]|nr:hypothetical protein [Longimicrobium sp.]